MLPLPEFLSRYTEILDIKQIAQARLFMIRAMHELFSAKTVCLFGRDETNENFIELAAQPKKDDFYSVNIDACGRKTEPLAWAFQQLAPLSLKSGPDNLPLRQLKQQFLPAPDSNGFVFIPGIYKNNPYPDLVFLVIGENETITPERLVVAGSFANHCATFNRLKTGMDQIGFREKQLTHSVAKLSSTLDRQNRIRSSELASIILGTSKDIHKVREDIIKFGPMDLSILIQGDTGTGKEMVAKAIHNASDRCSEPFLAVNMAEINPNLIESMFFGHVKGAFTGAEKDKTGLLGEVRKGTLFLDEIGDLPLDLQAKLLRVLQEKQYRPVGASEEKQFNARVISATHKDLGAMVKAGSFRKDLYYRLAENRIRISPLETRPDDIIVLANHFLDEYNMSSATGYYLDKACNHTLLELSYPGNVRQLKSLIKTICRVAGDKGNIDAGIIRSVYKDNSLDLPETFNPASLVMTQGFQQACEAFEKKTLDDFMQHFNGSRQEMAQILQISERSLFYKLRKYGLEGIRK